MTPTGSPWEQFANAVRTGQTPATKALNRFFKDPAEVMRNPLWEVSQKPGAWDNVAPFEKQIVAEDGFDFEVFKHLRDDLSPQSREKVRGIVVSAFERGDRVFFDWSTHNGEYDGIQERRDEATRTVSITFLSPRSCIEVNTEGGQVDVRYAPAPA